MIDKLEKLITIYLEPEQNLIIDYSSWINSIRHLNEDQIDLLGKMEESIRVEYFSIIENYFDDIGASEDFLSMLLQLRIHNESLLKTVKQDDLNLLHRIVIPPMPKIKGEGPNPVTNEEYERVQSEIIKYFKEKATLLFQEYGVETVKDVSKKKNKPRNITGKRMIRRSNEIQLFVKPILELVDDNPNLSVTDIVNQLPLQGNIPKPSRSTIYRILRKHKRT